MKGVVHVVTDAKKFNINTGILDPTQNTFKSITLENHLEDGQKLKYYICQEAEWFHMFRVRSSTGEVSSFEMDLEEIFPSPFDQAVIEPGEKVEIYLLNLRTTPAMYSLTFQNAAYLASSLTSLLFMIVIL
jgi:hypothetical protein